MKLCSFCFRCEYLLHSPSATWDIISGSVGLHALERRINIASVQIVDIVVCAPRAHSITNLLYDKIRI